MNSINHAANRRIAAVLVALMMLITIMPTTVVHAAEYGFQPENATDAENSLLMKSPSNIKQLNKADDYYLNEIIDEIDGTKDIKFTFTMSAGMNNFSDITFKEHNMPLIQIIDSESNVVASYGNGKLKYLGSHLTDEENNHGSHKTDSIDIGVDQGVLKTGDYIISFGKNIRGNNKDRILGKDIKFKFHVRAALPLNDMIDQAQNFLNQAAIGTGNGQYPSSEKDKLQSAITHAKTRNTEIEADNSLTVQQKIEQGYEESEILYKALQDFKQSRIVAVQNIRISGVPATVEVGDQGTATADVSVDPSESQYKDVTWTANDNILIDKFSGTWRALYSGKATITATSATDPTKSNTVSFNVNFQKGNVAVTIRDKDIRLSNAMEKSFLMTGDTAKDITSLKVITIDDGCLNEEDIRYIDKSLENLHSLDLEKSKLSIVSGGEKKYNILGANAFAGKVTLETVKLPKSLTTINLKAFYNCKNLRTIEIPSSVTAIGGGAFAGCISLNKTMKLFTVCPPDYNTSTLSATGGDTFKGLSGDLPASVTAITVPYGCEAAYRNAPGWKAFKIINEMLPKELTVNLDAPGELANASAKALGSVSDDEITNLRIISPKGVQLSKELDIEKYLQSHFLNATTIDLSQTEFAGNTCNANTFAERVSLKKIRLPEDTTNIGKKAFAGCISLNDITIPEKVNKIGDGAFSDCKSLKNIVLDREIPADYDGSIFDPDYLPKVIVPPQSVAAYKEKWSQYKNNIVSQIAISLSAKTLSLEVATTKTLTAKVTVYNNNSKEVMWTSSNERVATVDDYGRVKGIKPGTAVITATTLEGLLEAKCTVTVKAPAAPKAKAASAGYNKNKITWSGVSGATGYEVFYSTKKTGTYAKRTLSSSTRSYIHTGINTGTTYYYKVRAYKTVGKEKYAGSYSSLVSAKPTLSRPTSVKAKRGGSKKIKVYWKKVTGANGYVVYRSTKKTKGYKAIKTIKSSRTANYTNSKLKKGKRYYYKVRAYRTVRGKKVYSSFSSTVSYKAK